MDGPWNASPASAAPFAYPAKSSGGDHSPVTATVSGGKASPHITTTTTSSSNSSTQQRSGWANSATDSHSADNATAPAQQSPISIQHVSNNYQIVNHVTIQVGSTAAAAAAAAAAHSSSPTQHDDEPSDAIIESVRNVRKSSPTSAAAGVVPPLMIPRPPESARPSTTKSPSSQQHQPAPPSGSVTARPNTARDGPAPKQSGPSVVPSGGSKPSAAAGSTSASAGTPVAAAASGGNAGAPAVSHYAVGRTIGEGTFGKVVKGIHKLTGLPVAIKILEKERIVDLADVERVKREIHILTRVRHPNVIRLFEVIDSPRHIFLIMEHCSSGELFDFIVAQGRVKEDQACRIFHQILNGVDYFHNKNIIHRDLKPENLLLCQNTGNAAASGSSSSSSSSSAVASGSSHDFVLKIVDFGLGNVTKHGKLLKTACGSPCYAAPEMIAGKRYVGQGSDLWSLGVILFALVCGYLPFEDGNTARLYEKIMQGEYEIPEFVSGEARDLIQKLLTTDPRKRYNAEQVRRHSWYARMQVSTDPFEEAGGAQAPVVPGPQASGKRVRRTIGGQNVDDEHEIDQEVLRHMVMLSYHPQQVVESINNNRHDHFAATYHLLLLKKNLASKQQGQPTQKTNAAASATSANGSTRVPAPPVVPRIPTSGAPSNGAPLVPSAPVASHHHPVPPQSQKPSQHQQRPGTQGGNPAAAFSQSQPQPPSAARVQSAGTVRPSIPGSAAGAYPVSARPTTSYVQTKPSVSGDVVPQAAWQSEAQSSPLGVANGVNGGTGVNSYMQHYQAQQQQQAALYGQQQQQPTYSYASATGASGARPPSSASGRTPAPPKPSNAPKSASSGAYRISSGRSGGRTGSQQQKAKSSTGPLSQSLFVTNPNAPMDQQMSASLGYPSASPNSVVASALAHRSAHLSATGGVGSVGLAIGPATGRPMTSRITGSTGGVSHRLYLPPSEKAAHDLAAAAALAASFGSSVGSRPGTGTGARPSSGGYGVPARPGTSASTYRGHRPPSGARNIPSGSSASARGSSGGAYKGNGRDLDDDDDWDSGAALSKQPPAAASGPSAFNAQLSALSFKSARTILEELQRVMAANGLQSTLLPPSSSAPAPPGGVGVGSNGLAISSLRPPSREDGAAAVAATAVLECRQGPNRFQFHVAPLPAASARIAHDLDADAGPNSPTHSFSVRVKRVLGDAQTFKDLCARILPQLKL